MGHLKDQKNLTNGKGWKNVFVGSIKGTKCVKKEKP